MPDLTSSIIATMRHPVLVLEQDLSVILANPAFCKLFRTSPEETVGTPLARLGGGESIPPELTRRLEEVRDGGTEIMDFPVEQEFAGLGERIMLVNACYLREDGDTGKVLLAIEDITERERDRWLLEGEKEFAEKVVDASRDALLILDWNLRVKSANQTFYETFEVDPAETEGRLVYELGNGQWDIPRLRELLEDVLPENNAFNDFEVDHDFREIGRKIMLLNARRVDHVQLILLAIEDVTERRGAESELRASAARLTAILEHIPAGVGLMDGEGHWIHLNAEMRRFMDPQLSMRDPEVAQRWHGYDDQGQRVDPSQYPGARALQGEPNPPPVDFLTDVTGEPRWVRFAAVPIPCDKGRTEEAVAVLRDITAEKQAHENLRASEERLRESESRLAAALKAGNLGVHDYYPQTGRVEWDAEVHRLWGVPDDEEVTYETFLAGVHPDDRPSVDRAVAEAFDPEGSGLYATEYRVIHRDTREVRWVRADGEVTFENGVPVRLVGTVTDITERRRGEQERELLAHELSHRVKNTLGVVQALATQTGRYIDSVEEYLRVFLGRLDALSRAHSLLVDATWRDADLKALVERALDAYLVDHPEVIEIVGESWQISAQQALGLSLVLHELGTNAAKFGALSRSEGRVRVSWHVEETEKGSRVRLEWQERHGPVVRPPEVKGFGTQLIENASAYELDGEARIDYQREGVRCTIVFPVDEVN